MEVKHWKLISWKKLKDSLTNEQFQWLNTFQWEYYNLLMKATEEYYNSRSINFANSQETKPPIKIGGSRLGARDKTLDSLTGTVHKESSDGKEY